MSNTITVSNVDIGVCVHSGTYGTAADMLTTSGAALIHASSLTYTVSDNNFQPRDVGFSNQISRVEKLERTVDVTMSCDISYNGAWAIPLAAFLGSTTASGVEQTVSGGDYKHVLRYEAESTIGLTMAYLAIEDDKVIEFPTLTVTDVEISMDNANVGTVTFTMIGSDLKINADAVNSASDLDSLSYPTYRAAVLGGGGQCANHYFRLADHSTGTPLDADDELEIINYTLSMSRPYQRIFTLKGCDSLKTAQPLQIGLNQASMAFTLGSVDSDTFDSIAKWNAGTQAMSELLLTSPDQIDSGEYASIKVQCPGMLPASEAPVLGFGSNAELVQPVVSYQLITAEESGAAAGMTDPSNDSYLAFVLIDDVVDNYGSSSA